MPAALPGPETLADWWSTGPYGGLKPVITAIDDKGNAVVVHGDVVDPQESAQPVGAWRRRAETRRGGSVVVVHDELKLDDAAQGRGFGRAWHTACEGKYRAFGVTAVELLAEDVGGYVWASCGFEFGGAAATSCRAAAMQAAEIVRDQEHELDELLTEGRITEAQGQGFLACVADADALGARTDGAADLSALLTGKYCTPAEIAAHGSGAAWMEGDRRMWLGKALLIGSRWQGFKRLRAEPG
jgi:hypothetical protein